MPAVYMPAQMFVLSATIISLLTYTPIAQIAYHTQKPIENRLDTRGLGETDALSPVSSSSLQLIAAAWQGKFKVDTISGGHSRTVYCVAFSPQGNTLASSSGDRTIKIWNLSHRKLLHTFRGHTNWVSSVAFSPDGQILASASGDKTIKLWDLRNGKLIDRKSVV